MKGDWKEARLDRLDLTGPEVKDVWQGVYVIHYYSHCQSVILYVGSGDVPERLMSHRCDQRFAPYKDEVLMVTWLFCPGVHQNVERYLADKLDPIFGDAHPNVRPLSVDLPFEIGMAHYIAAGLAELMATK